MLEVVMQVGAPILIVVLMFGIGMALTVADFQLIARQPLSVAIGVFGQIILLPAFAFGLASVSGLEPALAVGLVLVAACPGGAVSNLFVHLSGGATALSITLTTLNTFITMVSIPLYVTLALDLYMPADSGVEITVAGTALRIAVVALVPILLGMAVRAKWTDFAKRAQPWVSRLAIGFLILLIASAVIGEGWDLFLRLEEMGIWITLLYWTGFFAGLGLAWALRRGPRQIVCLGFEMGCQNAALATALAFALFPDPHMAALIALGPMVYATVSTVFNFSLMGLIRWRWGAVLRAAKESTAIA